MVTQPHPHLVHTGRLASLALFVALLVALVAGPYGRAQTPLQQDWHVFVDETEGIALDVPPTHAVGSGQSRIWYVHGFIDGEPMVPDVSITFIPGAPDATLAEIIGDWIPDGALIENVWLGRGVPGHRVTAEYESMEGNRYVSSFYVVPVTEGAYVISRYESFDWELFEHVALSFRFVK